MQYFPIKSHTVNLKIEWQSQKVDTSVHGQHISEFIFKPLLKFLLKYSGYKVEHGIFSHSKPCSDIEI